MLRFGLFTLGLCLVLSSWADDASSLADDAALAELNGGQLAKLLPILVTDDDGQPIAGVTITPWALRSSQGHGHWGDEEDGRAEMNPKAVTTDDQGMATVLYPYYRNVTEQTRTFSVSVNATHPEFTLSDSIHVDVPLTSDKTHATIEMQRGAKLAVAPQLAGDASIAEFHLVSSDPSLWEQYPSLTRQADRLEFDNLSPGPFRGMLVRLVDDQAIAFSDPFEMDLKPGPNETVSLEMHPAIDIHGRLGDEVPRPVRAGRVTAIANPRKRPAPNFDWTQWAAVDAAGEFVIKGWPRSETLQVIALCEGYIACNGHEPVDETQPKDTPDPPGGLTTAVEIAKTLASPEEPPNKRPQVFRPDAKQPINIRMSPLVPFEITVVDADNQPIKDVFVGASPNVRWWNWGSQIYAGRLMRSIEWLTDTAPDEPWDSDSVRGFDMPFYAHSATNGSAGLHLPPGKQTLFAYDKTNTFELPIFMGRRDRRVTVMLDEPTNLTLQLERTGVEKLGEYDKLAGVVFGCSTREGKRICALPEVREKMDEFARRLREADDPRDPMVLAEAYLVVADAFERAGDQGEADKWRSKAETEKAKL
ncbi:MAG: hypothetical protein AAGD07_06830 [Planctomycetota bacterium]